MKLRVTIVNYRHTLGAVPKPRHFAFSLATAEPNIIMHGFSKYGARTPPGMPHTVYWYAALTKYENIKWIQFFKR
jgi:hypothetical protein